MAKHINTELGGRSYSAAIKQDKFTGVLSSRAVHDHQHLSTENRN